MFSSNSIFPAYTNILFIQGPPLTYLNSHLDPFGTSALDKYLRDANFSFWGFLPWGTYCSYLRRCSEKLVSFQGGLESHGCRRSHRTLVVHQPASSRPVCELPSTSGWAPSVLCDCPSSRPMLSVGLERFSLPEIYICAVQQSSHWPHMAVEHLRGVLESNWGTAILTWSNLNITASCVHWLS